MASEPEKTKSARTENSSPKGGKPPGGKKPAGDGPKPPVLTERQRIEARRKREARRRRQRRSQPGNALSRGVRATGHEIVRTARFLARTLAAGFESTGPLGRRLRSLAKGFGSLLVAIGLWLVATVASLARAAGRGLSLLDRTVTPRRALLTVGMLAVALLVLSQFTDYRATAIGQPGYAGIEDVITAPRVDVRSPLDTHSVILLAVALLAAAGLVGTIRTGRRIFSTLLLAAGIATLAVTGLIDTRSGLDLGDADLSYADASALLLSGFWLQLACGVVLAWSGLFLPAATSRRPARRPAVIDRRSPA